MPKFAWQYRLSEKTGQICHQLPPGEKMVLKHVKFAKIKSFLQQKVSKSGNSVTKKQLLLVKTALKSLGIILPSIKVFKNNKYLQLMANLGKCQFYCKKEMFFRMEHFSVPRPVCNSKHFPFLKKLYTFACLFSMHCIGAHVLVCCYLRNNTEILTLRPTI
jgi:hypothetical protein